MANQTANAAQIQDQINSNAYVNKGTRPPYTLGNGHVSVSQLPNALQPLQFHANSVQAPSPSIPSGGSKRKHDDDEPPQSARKRKVKVFDVETSEVVSGEPRQVGARHWTDQEKGRLFNWLLGRDDSWEGFSTQMNTVFRDGSTQVFDNKKTFTAIKSCYHRNVETFKQIYAFEKYLIQVTSVAGPSTAAPPGFVHLPPSFEGPTDRLAFLDRRLEAARSLPVETGVGNLSPKVVDHWCRKGWYVLFKRRFREDPSNGQLTPYFGKDASSSLLGKGLSTAAAVLFPQPDPPGSDDGEGEDEDEAAEPEVQDQVLESYYESQQQQNYPHDPESQNTPAPAPAQKPTSKPRPRRKTPAAIASSTARFRVSQAEPQPTPQPHPAQPSPGPVFSAPAVTGYPGYPPHSYSTAHMYPQPSPHYDYSQVYSPPGYPMHNPQVQQLSQIAQTLITTCTTLVERLRTQTEEGREMLELMRKREQREQAAEENDKDSVDQGADTKERAELATQVLANPDADEEVKQAAKAYLKRLFA